MNDEVWCSWEWNGETYGKICTKNAHRTVPFIEAESGLINVLELNNAIVGQNLKYEIPEGEEWRIDMFSELVQMSMRNLYLESSQFTNAELGVILDYVCTT